MVSRNMKSGLFMGFGATLVVLGAVMVVFWPPIFETQLRKMMTLTEDSMSFGIWRETPIPMYLEMFFYNISNVKEILAGTAVKLKVDEIGPYVFREQHTKTNLTWNDNSTLTFYNQRWWHYEPDRSVGHLSDEITSINPVIVTVANMMRNERFSYKVAVQLFLRLYHSNMFLKANVSNWVFEGIRDPILDFAHEIPNLPTPIPFDKFGWFYKRNGSIEFDGSFNMNTGASEFSRLGNVEQWRYSNRTHFRGECGEVKGSTGELWAPEYGQEEVFIFSSDLCTYLILSKEGDVTVEGIDGVQYSSNNMTFDNGHNFPRMECFCEGPVSSNDCLPPGALNVSACRDGAPVFVSLPHLYHADPYYPSKIDGLNATQDMNFKLSLEMFTGMPLGVSAQMQVNLLVRHITGIPINNALPDGDTLVPMFWFRQEMDITSEYARLARRALRARYWIPYVFYLFTAIGAGLVLTGIIVLMRKLLISPETEPILTEESTMPVES